MTVFDKRIERAGASAVKQRTRFLLLALLAVCLLPFPVQSLDLNGRVSSDLYAYEGTDDDHLRPYLRFRANALVWRSPTGRTLRLHTSLRWTSDLADRLPSDPQLFVYDAYAHVAGLPGRADLHVGRMFVYSGVGSTLMDGGRIQLPIVRHLDLDLFGGSAVSSEDPETVRSLGDGLVAGGRLGADPDPRTHLGLSVMMKRRDGNLGYLRVGIDGRRSIGPAEAYGRVSYNAADARLAEVQLRTTYRPGAWHLSGEYHWREPSVASNSVFALVNFHRHQIARVETRRRLWRQLSLAADLQATASGGDESWRTGIGFSAPAYALSWIHQTGEAGENDGVSGYLNRSLGERWDCYVSANLFRYRVQLEQVERSDAYASTAGLRWRPGAGMTILAEGQHLRNAVSKSDGRLLLRISKDFSFSSERGGKER